MSTVQKTVTGHKVTTDPDWIERQRIVNLREASRLSGLSVDTILRHHRAKIIRLSPRRNGMRVSDALSLSV